MPRLKKNLAGNWRFEHYNFGVGYTIEDQDIKFELKYTGIIVDHIYNVLGEKIFISIGKNMLYKTQMGALRAIQKICKS